MKALSCTPSRQRLFPAVLAALTVVSTAHVAVAAPKGGADTTELGLEGLLKLEITSVSRRAQPFKKTTSAVYVVTSEDIRPTGVTSIPDALRLAPGVHVMQMDGSKWANSIRGFTGRFSNSWS